MYYYNTNGRKRKWIGGVAAVIYLALWTVLCFVVRFTFPEPADMGEGILINFGNVELAGGEEDTALSEEIGQLQQPSSAPSAPQEFVTQEFTDAPEVAVNPQKPVQKPADGTTEEQPRRVNPQALFPGQTAGSTSPSEGTATGAGNQGNLAGDPAGSHNGTGTGTSGISFELPAGRKPVGNVVKPVYPGNERGRFIVKVHVTVNPEGNVVSVEYRSQGSTTNSRSFVDEAIKAARRQKFTPSTEDNLQTGVITYIFNVN